MRNIGLVLKRTEKKALRLGEEICRFLKEHGKQVLVETSSRDLAEAWHAKVSANISDEADLLVVLGGDGTILKAANLLNSKPTPVLGVNLGRVGYMAEVAPGEAVSELEAVLAGEDVRDERMMLQIRLPNGHTARVLNDVVIHWSRMARLIDLGIVMGDSKEIELRADGLIVATPIGSSAYSYAAHGPLVHPQLEGILLTPLCPYSGLKRPLVIPPTMKIQVNLKKGTGLSLTLDGHTTFDLELGETLEITRSSLPFIMVRSRVRDYFGILKEKLGLL